MIAYLADVANLVPGTNFEPFVEDLFVVATGQAQIAVQIKQFPNSSGALTVTSPKLGNTPTTFVCDICVRQLADFSPVAWIPSGTPAAGQYTVNNSTGQYQFGDSAGKLINYVMSFGPFTVQPQFWTSGGLNISFGSHTYLAIGPFINTVRLTCGIGLNVDKVDMEIAATPTDQLPASMIPILQGLTQGYFDGAAVHVMRAVMPFGYGNLTTIGTVDYFKGEIGEISEVGRTHAKFEARSRLQVLNRPVPRNTFQPACRHPLYGSGCTLNRTSFEVTGSVQAGSNASQILINLPSYPADAPGPAAAPTLSVSTPSSGVNLVQRQEFAVVTYVTATGETLPSPEANTSQFNAGAGLGGNQILVVHSPPSASGAIGWNCYIGDFPGGEYLQNSTPIPIGTNYTEPTTGPVQGSPPPILATNGYFSEGVIWFTSGANAGLFRSITTHDPSGALAVLNLVKPLPNIPAPGDSFLCVPGCDRRLATCSNKFNNSIHFGGFPYVPDPGLAVGIMWCFLLFRFLLNIIHGGVYV